MLALLLTAGVAQAHEPADAANWTFDPWIILPLLAAAVLYGAGLRLLECLRLRVKDVDFTYNHIVVRDGKGRKDRVTMLPQQVKAPLQRHLHDVQQLHGQDVQAGAGHVYLPYALERKYPNANREWVWQYVFPAAQPSRDPRTGIIRRHHVHKLVLQRAVHTAVRKAEIPKAASCHTLRNASTYCYTSLIRSDFPWLALRGCAETGPVWHLPQLSVSLWAMKGV